MLKVMLLILLFPTVHNAVLGQSSQYVLTSREKGTSPNIVDYLLLPRDLTGEGTFKGLPDNIDYRIGCFDFQKEQTAYEKYRQKQPLSTQDSMLLIENDTAKLSTMPTNHRLFFLTYFEKDKKITVADQNYNHDFSDDKVYEFKIKGNQVEKNTSAFADTNIQYEYVENKQIISRKIPLRIEPFNKRYIYKNYPDGRFHVNVQVFEHVKGTITVNHILYYFTACSGPNQKGIFKEFEMHYSSMPFADSIRFGTTQMVMSKDTISMGGHTYTGCFSTFGDTFFLKPYDLKEIAAINLSDDLSKKITTDKHPINLAQLQSGFTILDFWGTWCTPCVQDIPELGKLHKQYSASGVNFMGIAVDGNQDKVEKFRISHKIPYPIIFENLNLGSDWIFKKMQINVFPTYVILNKESTVIFSTNNIEELKHKLGTITKQ